jgi:tetratricopeptide (TPR) repeat protein
MRNDLRISWFAWLALATLAAAPALQPEDLVRQGNAAFARGDLVTAGACYAQAEERTLDPGLVAFNEATVLYQLGRYREAELHYRRCREDAQGIRRSRVLYGLGNSLVQQARGQDVRRLRDAIGLYEQCLQAGGEDASLISDARHNLELARLLLLQARVRKESSNAANEDQGSETPQPEDQRNDARFDGDDAGSLAPEAMGKPERASDAARDPNAAAAKANQQPSPGKGDLPPIPDEDDLKPLSPEDTTEYLKQAGTRIATEHRSYRERPMPPAPPNVKDW